MQTELRILLVEDSESDAALMLRQFEKFGYVIHTKRVEDAEGFSSALQQENWDVIISDYNVPSFHAPQALKALHATGKDIPFVVVSGSIGEHVAVEMMKAGANDYLLKDRLTRLVPAVEREIRDAASRRERRTTQAALLESQAMLQAVVASALDAVIVMDSEGCVLFWNPSAERIFQFSSQEATGQLLHDLVMPERYRGQFVESMHHYLRTGTGPIIGRTFELIAMRKDGREFPVELSVAPLKRNGALHSVGVVRDITERKRTEARLTGESRLLKQLVEGRSLTQILEGIQLHVRTRFPNAQIIVCHPDEPDLSTHAVDDFLKDRIGYSVPICSRSGALLGKVHLPPRPSQPLKAEEVQFLEAAADLAAISLEKTIGEETLRRSQERLSLHMQGTPMAYVELDLDQRITYWNPAAESVFGYSSAEVLGKPAGAILTIAGPHPVHHSFLDSLSEHSAARTTIEHVTKDGGVIVCEWSHTRLVNSLGKAIGTACLGQDITELKLLMDSLRKSKEAAEEATRAKSEFLSTMSHEIRTPMNGIIGMSGLLLDSNLNSEQQSFTQAIRSSADALLSIINDILDFSKVEAGKLEIERVPFNLQTAIEDVIDLVSVKAYEKKLELLVWYPPGAPREFLGDVGRIRQILLNLVNNALKFTDKGHVLVEVDTKPGHDGVEDVRVSVQDTGIGIPSEKFPLLFSNFTQLDSSSKRRYGGSGLGLAISRRLASLMDGGISVVSEPGEGSTFSLYLPLACLAEGHDGRPIFADLRGTRVLVVEDHQISRFVCMEWCSSWGMRVSEAASAHDALKMFRDAQNAGDPYAICILDYLLPDCDGGDLAHQLHAEAKRRLPIVLLTAYDFHQIDRASVSEFAVTVSKPTRSAVMLDAVSRALFPNQTPIVAKVPRPIPAQSAALFSGTRVLLVEDNAINQRVASALLRKLGCHVEIAGNGREAMTMVHQFQFDMVFMDCQMPEMDGFEATMEIRRSRQPYSQIPIIAMTAGAMEADREKCIVAGMNDYLAKPVMPESLRAMVELWHRRRAAQDTRLEA